MRHGMVHWFEPGELDEDRRRTYEAIVRGPRAGSAPAARFTDDQGRLEGPFNAMLVNPVLGLAVQSVGAALRYRTSLSERLRELAILTVAAEERSGFEWLVHERLAPAAGISRDELAVLHGGGEPPTLSPEERLAREVVLEMARTHHLGDGLVARAVEVLGEVGLVELVDLVGYYQLLAMSMHVLRTPLPEGAAPPFG